MEILFLPRISESNYPWLEASLHCHRSYDGWIKLVAEWATQAKAEGRTVRYVTVDPGEFRQYLNTNDVPHDLDHLLTFTHRRGSGEAA